MYKIKMGSPDMPSRSKGKRRNKESEDLLSVFIRRAEQWGKEMESGIFRKANKLYGGVIQSFRDLIRSGVLSEDIRNSLLRNENKYIRLSTASMGLVVLEDKIRCERVLMELQDENGFVGISSKYTLLEWKSGNLHFPGLE